MRGSLRRVGGAGRQLFDTWLEGATRVRGKEIHPIDQAIAERWARLSVPDPLPFVGSLLAATALQHDMTFVTRNTRDIERTGVRRLNPFLGS